MSTKSSCRTLSKYAQFRNAIFLWNFSVTDEKNTIVTLSTLIVRGQYHFCHGTSVDIVKEHDQHSQRLPLQHYRSVSLLVEKHWLDLYREPSVWRSVLDGDQWIVAQGENRIVILTYCSYVFNWLVVIRPSFFFLHPCNACYRAFHWSVFSHITGGWKS